MNNDNLFSAFSAALSQCKSYSARAIDFLLETAHKNGWHYKLCHAQTSETPSLIYFDYDILSYFVLLFGGYPLRPVQICGPKEIAFESDEVEEVLTKALFILETKPNKKETV